MPTSSLRSRLPVAAGLAGALVLLALGGAKALSGRQAAAIDLELERGKALYTGAVDLKAQLVGHDSDLPAEATRCSNCHPLDRSATPGPQLSPLQEQFAPLLTREALMQARPRRGGPASSYDQASFCGLLADGIDPAQVMVPQTMPRYRLSTEECRALWTYVTSL